MTKFLGSVLLGVVLGAATVEILRKQKPELLEKVDKKVKAGIDSLKAGVKSIKTSFAEGYEQAVGAKAE